MRIERLAIQDLRILTELFDYNDVKQMVSECTHNIQKRFIDIFVLYQGDAYEYNLYLKR